MFVCGTKSLFADGSAAFSETNNYSKAISMADAKSLRAFCLAIDKALLENICFNDVYPYATSIIKLKDKWVSFVTDVNGDIYNVHIGSRFDNICRNLMKSMYPNTDDFNNVLKKYLKEKGEQSIKDTCYGFKVRRKRR